MAAAAAAAAIKAREPTDLDLIFPKPDRKYMDPKKQKMNKSGLGQNVCIRCDSELPDKMPINGGTRMLRARRKDINVKPNRRLDRKSSRGMLFENEELRMRTITINAEVEQGQHALKKLRRENEQLRREMWSLRDEYDKMEKLLRKKETDEDSYQEMSDSDENYSQTDDSEDEGKEAESGTGDNNGNQAVENVDGIQSASKFGNLTSARAFDGLSVIDEQTEETTTQTTESVIGCGTGSRSNSANRTFNQANPAPMRIYEDQPTICPLYDSVYHTKLSARKKGYHLYENDPAFMAYAVGWPDNGYDVRPSSPYPYPESIQPSYQKRFEVLQNLPPIMSRLPSSSVNESGWMFPESTKPTYDVYSQGGDNFVQGSFLPDKSARSPITVQIPQDLDYNVIQDRSGPDVFISDICAKKSVVEGASVGKGETPLKVDGGADEGIIDNVQADIDKIEISGKSDGNPNNAMSQDGGTKEAVSGAKLITAKSVDVREIDQRAPAEESVPCQNPNNKDAQPSFDNEDMARSDRASKFQSKLMVTLKTPTPKADVRTVKRVPQVQIPRTYQTLGYGVRSECQAMNKGYVGFSECRYATAASRTFADGNIVQPVLPGSTATTTAAAEKIDHVILDAEDIPVQHMEDGIALLTESEAASRLHGSQIKPIKIPPAPPPRTSSCPGTTIPDSSIGVTAIHHRTFRGAKSPTFGRREFIECHPEPLIQNPLMLSEPVATSSPTVLPRIFHHGHNLSLDNLSSHRKPVTVNDESSAEDISTKKTRTIGRGGRPEPPHLNKSLSSPSFGTFLRRKPSEHSVSSVENGAISHQLGHIPRGNPQNNISVSSSSGLDSPTKSDRRKRRVSIKFNKKNHPDDGEERVSDSRQHIASVRTRGRTKNRHDETDVTTSERERTNSVSSRASSGAAGSSRRKLSVSSNRTFINDEKIPWCGCWGNGCV